MSNPNRADSTIVADIKPKIGASQFGGAISPTTKVEVLIPDLCGNWEALEIIIRAQPEVLNHNTETVPRLYHRVCPWGQYDRWLEFL